MSAVAREYPFTDRDFALLQGSVARLAGIHLGEQKRNLVYSRLARRLRDLCLDDFASYCKHLEEHEDERQHLINAITTNLTFFFREEHHFALLDEELRRRPARPRHPFRIWSAGCSSGEEPYSMAICARRAGLSDTGVAILATDIDTGVLQRARDGVYKDDATSSVPDELRDRFFERGTGAHEGKVRVSPKLRASITFNQLNLMQAWPMRESFEVIFCRNVLIYFDKPTQQRLVERFQQMLLPGGLLCLGHSESLHDSRTFESIGATAYRKRL